MNVVSQIASDYQYHYGFNGQMKTNEWAGVGNHNTALFGEYDTRTGMRLNLDPKPTVWESPYSMFHGNPIWHSDVLLDSPGNKSGQGKYMPVPKEYKEKLPDFPESERLKHKNGARPSWNLGKGWHGEWDSQHGEIEVYDKHNKHQGAYDPKTGEKTKDPVKGRKPTYNSTALLVLKDKDIAANHGTSPAAPVTIPPARKPLNWFDPFPTNNKLIIPFTPLAPQVVLPAPIFVEPIIVEPIFVEPIFIIP